MSQIRPGRALFALAAALMFSACGSSDIGDILGSPSGGGTTAYVDEVRGTVLYVDTQGECLIELEDTRVTSRTNLRNDDLGSLRDGDRVTLHCDDRTVVTHEGQNYRPDALERGDEIVAEVQQSGNRLLVDRIDVLYDVTAGDGRADDYRQGFGDLRGTVRRVDAEQRTILIDDVEVFDRNLDDWSGDRLTLYYDTDTDVLFEGRRYQANNLEPGDEIEVDVSEIRGRLIAEEIEVVSDVRTSRY
jgi:hypothetical protein